MNNTTKAILQDPLGYPIPDSKEEKLKILSDLANQVLEGKEGPTNKTHEQPDEELDPAMKFLMRFEESFVIFAARIMYSRLGFRFSGNSHWVEFFTQRKDREVWTDNSETI